MNVHFFNNGDYKPQPKDNVKIDEVRVEIYPDRRRIWINVKITPFQERPNLLLVLRNDEGTIIEDASIIETMHFDNEFTMHLRRIDEPAGRYTMTVDLFYETRNPPQDKSSVEFEIPSEDML
jgi:hypothetical protein